MEYELNYMWNRIGWLNNLRLANEFAHQMNSIRAKANSNCSGFPNFNCPIHMPSISISGIDFCFEFIPDSRTLPYRLRVKRGIEKYTVEYHYVFIMSFWGIVNHGRTSATCTSHTLAQRSAKFLHFTLSWTNCGEWYKLLIDRYAKWHCNRLVFFCVWKPRSTTESRKASVAIAFVICIWLS